MDDKYNGWTNYATWDIYSWITSDERTYNYYKGLEAEAIKEEVIEGAYSLIPNASMYADILIYALNTVNWFEIADALTEN